ncbi:TPA: HD domain-containing protein [Candidatus Poribacteria bacterium]|nr:HD domain-containing protein [Candidatus Poribacteria bacterium]
MMDPEKILSTLLELDALTRLPRMGWFFVGIPDPERVSDHCYQTAVIAYFLAQSLDDSVDMGKILTMALFHESGEVRVTDLPRRAKKYIGKSKRQAEEGVIADVIGPVAPSLIEILDEFHRCESLEARIVEAAEEFQIILKAFAYARLNQGQLTEYLSDVERYDDQEIPLARKLCDLLQERMKRVITPLQGELP